VALRRERAIRSEVVLTDRNGVPFPPVRRLGPADVRQCVALSLDRGWSPEKAKWALMLDVSDVFGVDAPDGGLAGAVVLTRYGTRLASVGMLLVAARHGRRGLGRALMEHLLAEAGDATVTLVATDLGKPLYDKLGFRTIRQNAVFVGTFRAAATAAAATAAAATAASGDNSKRRTRPADAAGDMAAILDIDKAAFGADRSHLLTRLPTFAAQLRVLETDGRVDGFAAAWRNDTATVIGPVVAPDGAAARVLIADLAAPVRGRVRLDLDPGRPGLPDWAVRRGLQLVALGAVMAYGAQDPPGDRGRLFTPMSVALA
jgi:GNAT superfamily N-acetyltransferase